MYEASLEKMFQSSLELSPECNQLEAEARFKSGQVSILTRAFARVQRVELKNPIHSCLFQSSLELSPECNVLRLQDLFSGACFNPHSSFRPSATQRRPLVSVG